MTLMALSVENSANSPSRTVMTPTNSRIHQLRPTSASASRSSGLTWVADMEYSFVRGAAGDRVTYPG